MAPSKKLINSIGNVIPETLTGLSYAYPQLECHASKRVVLTPDWRERSGKVAIICGGGSGHEPWTAGFVGSGFLTASVSGSIFAAPPPNNVLHALQCVSMNNKAGILVVVPNYTGDCLNFGLAIEKARQEGLTVSELTVGEDCSIPLSEQGSAGRRGLTGLVFVTKIAGALAERGVPLNEIARVAEIVADNIATYAVGLEVCSMPGQGPMFHLPEDEIEVGLGVHAEAGYKRIKSKSAAEVVSLMLDQIIQTLLLSSGDSVAMIINNFGASSQLEQGIVVYEAVNQLRSKGIEPVRVYSGTLVTSLNSAGMHISILRLIEHYKTNLLDCLDEKTNAPAWPGCAYSIPPTKPRAPFQEVKKPKVPKVGRVLSASGQRLLRACLLNACEVIIDNEEKINQLDRGCGDGDCGTTLKHLAQGIRSSIDNLPLSYPSSLLTELSVLAEDLMGGTSGAIYSLMFTTAATELALAHSDEEWSHSWFAAFRGSLDGIMRYSKAKLNDRTMLDALEPACRAFEENLSTPYKEAAVKIEEAAWQGCNDTKNMEPKAGRASYVKQIKFLQDVDAGAYGIATWISAIADAVVYSKQ